MRTTVLEEKMTSNERNRIIALHAAESALRDGEAETETATTILGFNAEAGKLLADDTDLDFTDTAIWTSANAIDATSDVAASNSIPQFTIKEIGVVDDDGSLNIENAGGPAVSPGITYFRVTSRGLGRDNTAQVIIESNYGKRLDRF